MSDLPTPGTLVSSVVGRVRFAEPPAPLRVALTAQFDSWAIARRPHAVRQRVAALLSSTGGTAPLAAGLRGAATDRARQLLFSTDAAEVALHVAERGAFASIDGQVLPLADDLDDDVVVELWRGDALCASVDADAAGSFVLDRVPGGTYRLVVAWTDLEIVVDPFEVETVG